MPPDISTWFARARPGDVLVYHTGDLATDRAFWARYGIDPETIAARLWAESENR